MVNVFSLLVFTANMRKLTACALQRKGIFRFQLGFESPAFH
nr:MAG TPA: hypothetical protein [Caudoviricetes sp.]